VNDDTSKVEIMVRFNKLQHHFVHVVTSKKIGKLIHVCDINRGSSVDDYTTAGSGAATGHHH
jgi:hypothetical protein